MRGIVLTVVAILVVSGYPAWPDDSPVSDGSLRSALALFDRNHCEAFRDPADQLFCGDGELNEASVRLNSAIAQRLDRLANRRLAIAENAEWIRDRNSSCGIFGRQGVSNRDVISVKNCLLKETEERIAILTDPNFDCLA